MTDDPANLGRRKGRRILAILLVLVAIGEAARRWSSPIRREISLHLAGQDVAAGRFEELETRLDALISAEPRDTRPRLLLVQLYRRQGRITEAEETLQRAVELGLPLKVGRTEHDLLQSVQRAAFSIEPEDKNLADR